jgi:hypothetical protein
MLPISIIPCDIAGIVRSVRRVSWYAGCRGSRCEFVLVDGRKGRDESAQKCPLSPHRMTDDRSAGLLTRSRR